ncbi:competence protein ComJ [Alteromonas sp. McT4-15]|uniref:competence protein ComJ n=1 Tax=Alteromonas sp. McT4-15 TaxID=2881256 RepID=UPI001CF82310|nr:competence protein ComJ [Alteromonas sp. McT4-15]
MANLVLQMYLSYSQICIFLSSLSQPFNDWSDRNVTQGFSWRDGSASFRALTDEGDHKINLFINEPIPDIEDHVVRAFKVPFETLDGNIEIASISDSTPLEISPGKYSLQVEFLQFDDGDMPEINIRLNKVQTDFVILKADEELILDEDLDLEAVPAT